MGDSCTTSVCFVALKKENALLLTGAQRMVHVHDTRL